MPIIDQNLNEDRRTLSNVGQAQRILEDLQRGDSITPLEALSRYGCMRLGARIFELRQLGYPIVSRLVKTSAGKHVSEYRLEQP